MASAQFFRRHEHRNQHDFGLIIRGTDQPRKAMLCQTWSTSGNIPINIDDFTYGIATYTEFVILDMVALNWKRIIPFLEMKKLMEQVPMKEGNGGPYKLISQYAAEGELNLSQIELPF